MRLTLVNTTTDGLNRGLGTRALQAFLRAHPERAPGWEVSSLEILHPTPWWEPRPFSDAVLQEVLATEPDLAGLSLLCWDLEAHLDLARRLKAERPGVRIVAGGPSATGRGAELLRTFPHIDAVVSGEGEEPLAALLAGWPDPGEVPGLALRRPDGTIAASPQPARALPFAELGSPLATGVYAPRVLVNLEFARGCTKRCRFCTWQRYGGGLRLASRERMRDDLALARAHPAGTALVLDSALNVDAGHLEDLAEARQAADPDGRLALHGFVDVPALDARALAQLKRLRLSGVEASLNSTNAAALRLAGRPPVDERAFERGLERLAAVCPVNLHLILGLPGDSLEGVRRTLAFVGRQLARLGPARLPIVTVFWLVVEHGSYHWLHREELGLEIQQPGMPYLLGARGFPAADLVRAVREILDRPDAARFRLDGPRALLEGVLPARSMITAPAGAA